MAPLIIRKSAIKHSGLTTNRVAYEDTLKNEHRRRRVFSGKSPEIIPAPVLVNMISVKIGRERLSLCTLEVNKMVSLCGLYV